MLDHVSIQCADVAESAAFYDAVLTPLGAGRVFDLGAVIGYGVDGQPSFWLGPLVDHGTNRPIHIAFAAPDRAAVSAFFIAAKALGGEILHEPRIFAEYHPTYFAAFVRDPNGHNVEAVCRQAP